MKMSETASSLLNAHGHVGGVRREGPGEFLGKYCYVATIILIMRMRAGLGKTQGSFGHEHVAVFAFCARYHTIIIMPHDIALYVCL